MTPKKVRAIKEVEVITDKKKIKLLRDRKRADILKLLSKKEMTVKQLGVALGRNPGTVMHHLDRLKKAGFVVQVRTERTTTGIVQRYYRATAKEYKFGAEEPARTATPPDRTEKVELEEVIRGLRAYGLSIPEDRMFDAVALLEGIVQKERIAKATIPPPKLRIPPGVKNSSEKVMHMFMLEMDPEYRRLRDAWYHFMMSFYAQGNNI
jgi:DNA-binding transcriptional ArsR family regulator